MTRVYTSVSEEVTLGDRRKGTGGGQPGLGLGALPGPLLPGPLLTIAGAG